MKKQLIYLLACIAIVFATASFTATVMSEKPATVEMYQGVYVFARCKPTEKYDYLGTVKTGAIVKNFRAGYLIALLVKKSKEDFPDGNALIFTDEDMLEADVVKMK